MCLPGVATRHVEWVPAAVREGTGMSEGQVDLAATMLSGADRNTSKTTALLGTK